VKNRRPLRVTADTFFQDHREYSPYLAATIAAAAVCLVFVSQVQHNRARAVHEGPDTMRRDFDDQG
jgi:hypothetical protein